MPGASKIHSFLLVSIHRRELHYCIQEALRRVDRQHKELKLTNPSPLAKWHLRHPRLHTANVRLQGRTTLFAPDHLPLRSCPRQIALPCFINFDSSAVHMFATKNIQQMFGFRVAQLYLPQIICHCARVHGRLRCRASSTLTAQLFTCLP